MFFRRRRQAPAQPTEERFPEPMDPALYGHLVDGELPVGWLEFHHAFLSSHDAILYELDQASWEAPDEPSAAALHSQYLSAFHDYHTECKSRGECFVKYFTDTHDGQDTPHHSWLAANTVR